MTHELALQGLRVLVVEDQYTIAAELTRLLEEHGAVVVGPFGHLALASAAARDTSQHLDAAVLDINLHSEAVFPVSDELRRRGIPFVFASGYQASALPAAYRNEPMVEKPVDTNALATLLLELVLSRRGSRHVRCDVAQG